MHVRLGDSVTVYAFDDFSGQLEHVTACLLLALTVQTAEVAPVERVAGVLDYVVNQATLLVLFYFVFLLVSELFIDCSHVLCLICDFSIFIRFIFAI